MRRVAVVAIFALFASASRPSAATGPDAVEDGDILVRLKGTLSVMSRQKAGPGTRPQDDGWNWSAPPFRPAARR